jgi:glycosyltransferase involved in cell wall biosynthesis
MTSGREPRRDGRDLRTLLRENAALRAENLALRELCHENAAARRQAARDRAQLDEILGSRAWALVQQVRRAAAIVGRRANSRADGPDRPSFSRESGDAGDDRAGPRHSRVRKVSVIVPNYNHAPYLEERLRSIFAQTYPPHEVIFLDDASSDESVAVARRLAPESPAPFRIAVNASNSGGTFRQWLKGIGLASGDLVWIAESDDTCRPGLLERLVPHFDDPEVMLAYCQSSRIGPDGRRYAADYLDATEDLSPVRWRYPYCVPGSEEVERALSQRNTIPNASAVVFRKPAEIEERADLESLRLGGDWLFYAMRIRRGKIAYVPEPLNGHRHHDRTVRSGFERAVELFEEQLRVKARIFETFPVTATAISGSMARGFAEYAERMEGLGPLPAMTEHLRLRPHIDRLRAIFRARVNDRLGQRILVVLSGVTCDAEQSEAIGLANEHAGRCPVFLCNALPSVLDPSAASRIDERVILLEGTLGLLPWSCDGHPRLDPRAGAAMSRRRADVVRELVRFHRIGAIHSQGPWADHLLGVAGVDREIAPLERDSQSVERLRPPRRPGTRTRGLGAPIARTRR